MNRRDGGFESNRKLLQFCSQTAIGIDDANRQAHPYLLSGGLSKEKSILKSNKSFCLSVSLSVCLWLNNSKTAEPIWQNFFC